MQIVAVPEPKHAVPREPGVLPQDVRVVRGPDLLAGPGAVSGCGVWADVEEAEVQEADF